MCRARPGPRCSNQGKHRYNKAVVHLKRTTAWYNSLDGDSITAAQKRKMLNAEHRMEAAKRVFYATPDGQEHLRDAIREMQEELHATRRRRSREILARRESLQLQVDAAQQSLVDGIHRRRNAYADLKLAEENNERLKLREQSVARGGVMGPNAHPLTDPLKIERRRAMLSKEPISLREWNEEDVSRANSWVETRAKIKDNPSAPELPVRAALEGNLEAGRVKIGEPIEGVEPNSIMLRVNSPDGSVTEAAFHRYIRLGENGKYQVVLRATSATSWEDSSPIDVTRQELGHMMNSSTVSRADSVIIAGEYDTLHGARTARGKQIASHNTPQVTALMGRDTMVARAGAEEAGTQIRGIRVWHRYREEE